MDSHSSLAASFDALNARVEALEAERAAPPMALIALRAGTYDGFLYGLSIAVAAAAGGATTKVFVAQWSVAGLRARRPALRRRSSLHRLFAAMLPSWSARLPVTHMNFLGMGTLMVRRALAEGGAANVEHYLTLCADLGVEFLICGASAATLGLDLPDLDPRLSIRICGMTEYLDLAARSYVSLSVG